MPQQIAGVFARDQNDRYAAGPVDQASGEGYTFRAVDPDATDGTALAGFVLYAADGTAMGQIDDHSGNAYHATASGSARGAYKTTGSPPNSQPYVSLDGSDDYYIGTTISNVLAAAAYTVLMVVRIVTADTNDANTYDNDPVWASASGDLGTHLKSAPTAWAYNNDGAVASVSLAIATGAWMVLAQRHAGGTVYLSRDGGSEVSFASGSTIAGGMSSTLWLGRNYQATPKYAHYDLAEFDTYNVDLGSTNLATAVGQLKTFYGIA